jgi:hypothetical protein
MALVTATAVIARLRNSAHLEYIHSAGRVREIECTTTGYSNALTNQNDEPRALLAVRFS